MDKIKDVLHKIKCFFIAVGRAVKKGARKIFSPEIKPGVRRVGRMFGAVLGTIARILLVMLLIGVLTGTMIGVFGAIYVTRYLDVDTDVPLNQFDLALTSHIYAKDPHNPGQYILLESLSGTENRIWVSYDKIPQVIIDAVVAIEDERFWSHEGVDWKRTIGAFYTLFRPGSSSQFGGSTITQQMIKNITGENDATVARKLQEIFRALAFERKYPGTAGKEFILEMYLNTVYFGRGCYGILTAADVYFGKDLDELTLAECAALIGITNNPSVYNPYVNPKNNKRRQEVILYKMFDLQMIGRHEYNTAKYEPLTIAGREGGVSGDKVHSWFVDQVINDATEDLMKAYGWPKIYAQQFLYSRGLNIYATIDLSIQEAMDAVWADKSCWPDSPDAEPPEAAMILLDHTTGEIKALIGGREKTGNNVFNLATMAKRQPGSAIKPLTVYSPAFDLGLVTPYSPIDDLPIRDVGGRGWPKNSPVGYDGHINILRGVALSKNTVSAQIIELLGYDRSFEYGVDRFGLSTMVESRTVGNQVLSDIDNAPLSMGALTDGATVRDMAGGYAAIANKGMRNKTRTYTHITNQNGEIVFENTPDATSAIKEKSAYYMEVCLISSVVSGTSTRAKLANMPVAGKTGTTSANKDRWFGGYTPYYTAVTWFGYPIGRDMSYYSRNPAVHMWQQVMEKAHEGLERKEFEPSEELQLQTYTFCIDSGLPQNDVCRLDPRGSRTATGLLDIDDIPRSTCNMHRAVDVCTLSNQLATPYCSTEPHMRKKIALLDITRWAPIAGFALGDEQYTMRRWQGGEPAEKDGEGREAGVPAAATDTDKPRYPVVAVGADGKAPANAFCQHCINNPPPVVTDPEEEDNEEHGATPPPESGEPPQTPELPDASLPPETPELPSPSESPPLSDLFPAF